jgi:hypothetical protein
MEIKIKRAYESPSDHDGYRILVDRLWPRGISKEKANIGFWPKELAPSTGLRHWYGHDPEKWSVEMGSPIKRPLSRAKTSPVQEDCFLLTGRTAESATSLPLPERCQLSCTSHPSGLRSCWRERFLASTLVRLDGPRKSSVPCRVQMVFQILWF